MYQLIFIFLAAFFDILKESEECYYHIETKAIKDGIEELFTSKTLTLSSYLNETLLQNPSNQLCKVSLFYCAKINK